MHIDKKIVEKIMGPIGHEEATVALFVVAKNSGRLKALTFDPGVSPEERARKLHKWAEQHRFVALIVAGQEAYAHANAAYVQQLEGVQEVEGRKLTVRALSDEESDQLAAVGEAFEEYVLENQEEEKTHEESETSHRHLEVRQFFATQSLVSDDMHMNFIIASLQNIPSKVILNCLKQFSEARREDEKQRKADERRQEIFEQELAKDISKRRIKKEAIESQDKKQRHLQQDLEHIDFVRGAGA